MRDAFEVVRRLRARQNAILEALPPHLLAEFRDIEAYIRRVDELLHEHGSDVQIEPPGRFQPAVEQAAEGVRPARVPLASRRQALRDFLLHSGPTTRGRILAATKIPPGTLSALLTERDFERNSDGLWRLKEGGSPPR